MQNPVGVASDHIKAPLLTTLVLTSSPKTKKVWLCSPGIEDTIGCVLSDTSEGADAWRRRGEEEEEEKEEEVGK